MKSGRTPPRAWKSINSLTDEFSETVSHPAIALTIFIGDRSSVASDHQPYVARHSETQKIEVPRQARVARHAKSIPRRLTTVTQRLRDMDPADLFRSGEVGDRSRDPQHAVETPRRKAHRHGSVGQ